MKFEYRGREHYLNAELIEGMGETQRIEFSWDIDTLSFGDVLELSGKIPVSPIP